jgi:hypothetical protein
MRGVSEADLYEPVKNLLAARGFTVRGEVTGCDVTAARGDELWVVELKLGFNTRLLFQAVERQKITPHVFVALPRPKRNNNKDFAAAQVILKKLDIGLITVALDSPLKHAEIILFPEQAEKTHPSRERARAKRSADIRKEMDGRRDDTPGGVTKTKVNTAFRERCVRIACLVERHGALSARELVNDYGCGKDAGGILIKNFYGWFVKAGKGRYALSGAGERYLADNAAGGLVAYYRMRAKDDLLLILKETE